MDKYKDFKINVQLFAEGSPSAVEGTASTGGAPAAEPATSTAESGPQLSIDEQIRMIYDKDNQATQEPTQNSEQQPTQQPVQDQKPADNPEKQPPTNTEQPAQQAPKEKILGKYETTGDLVKAFQSLQAAYTRDRQQMSEINRTIEQLKAEKAALEAKINNPQPPQQTQQEPIKDEFEELDGQALLDKFYENPREFMNRIEEKAYKKAEKVFNEKLSSIESKVNPVVETVAIQAKQERWNEATKTFLEKNPDMLEFREGMSEFIKSNRLHDSDNPAKVIEDAYYYARGLKYQPPQQIDPKTLLQDEKFLKEYVYSNPAIKDAIIKSHLEEVKNSQQGLPPVSSSSMGSPTLTPPKSINSLDEAHKAASDFVFGAR